MLKIRDDFPVEKLADYGFTKSVLHNIWIHKCVQDLKGDDEFNDNVLCELIVNLYRNDDKVLRIVVFNQYELPSDYNVDNLYAFPTIIFDMIKEGILVKE